MAITSDLKARFATENRIRRRYGIPECIHESPWDRYGNENDNLSDWAFIVQHEVDLYEEDQDSPDIKTRAQYNACKKALAKLRAAC